MLESLRKLHCSNIWKKLYLIKLRTIIGNEIIESWRVQKYQIMISKNSENNTENNKSHINILNNINILLNLIKYNYLFNKYSININLFVILLNNISNIFHFYDIQIDELLEYIICKYNNNHIIVI